MIRKLSFQGYLSRRIGEALTPVLRSKNSCRKVPLSLPARIGGFGSILWADNEMNENIPP